jgi:hypothetical protein
MPDWHISDKVLIESAKSLLSTFEINHEFVAAVINNDIDMEE